MQSLNKKYLNFNYTTKKFYSWDDCNEEWKESDKIYPKQLKANTNSLVAR